MRKSTESRIRQKHDNLPCYFVDSSVFLELFFRQSRVEDCRSFINRSRYKYKLMTSTLVLGEILKVLNEFEDEQKAEQGLFFFSEILRGRRIKIIPVSFEGIGNVASVKDTEPFIQPQDALIFASALTEYCSGFITIDTDFTKTLEKEFRMPIRLPSAV